MLGFFLYVFKLQFYATLPSLTTKAFFWRGRVRTVLVTQSCFFFFKKRERVRITYCELKMELFPLLFSWLSCTERKKSKMEYCFHILGMCSAFSKSRPTANTKDVWLYLAKFDKMLKWPCSSKFRLWQTKPLHQIC